MNAARMDYRRAVDWSRASNPQAIENVIKERLKRRAKPQSETEVCKWFYATPQAAVSTALTLLAGRGEITAEYIEGRRAVRRFASLESR